MYTQQSDPILQFFDEKYFFKEKISTHRIHSYIILYYIRSLNEEFCLPFAPSPSSLSWYSTSWYISTYLNQDKLKKSTKAIHTQGEEKEICSLVARIEIGRERKNQYHCCICPEDRYDQITQRIDAASKFFLDRSQYMTFLLLFGSLFLIAYFLSIPLSLPLSLTHSLTLTLSLIFLVKFL